MGYLQYSEARQRPVGPTVWRQQQSILISVALRAQIQALHLKL